MFHILWTIVWYARLQEWKSDFSNSNMCTTYSLDSNLVIMALQQSAFWLIDVILNRLTRIDGSHTPLQEILTVLSILIVYFPL